MSHFILDPLIRQRLYPSEGSVGAPASAAAPSALVGLGSTTPLVPPRPAGLPSAESWEGIISTTLDIDMVTRAREYVPDSDDAEPR